MSDYATILVINVNTRPTTASMHIDRGAALQALREAFIDDTGDVANEDLRNHITAGEGGWIAITESQVTPMSHMHIKGQRPTGFPVTIAEVIDRLVISDPDEDYWTLNVGRFNAVDDVKISPELAEALLKLKAEQRQPSRS